MVTAKELRMRAWNKLAENGLYGRYLLGVILLGLVTFAGVMVAVGILFGGTAGLAAVSKGGGVTPGLFGGSFVVSAVCVVLLLYAIGFGTWCQRAMAIAGMRGGYTLAHAFSGWGHGWKMAWVILVASTYASLWALLLIVPGIMATFSYMLAPYIQVDHPDWTANRCIAESKRLMQGNRWRLFCFWVSYSGWYLLAIAVACIPFVGNFASLFLTPYADMGGAAFYEDLLDRDESAPDTSAALS